jgi:hypothetical protein
VTTFVIDRKDLPESLLPFIRAERIKVEGEAGRVVLTPIGEFEPESASAPPSVTGVMA